MAKNCFVRTRLFWYRKPQTQVVPNRKKNNSKYTCRRSRRGKEMY